MDPELQKLMDGPSYDSTGADDDDSTLKELRANRGDTPTIEEKSDDDKAPDVQAQSDEADAGKDENGAADEGKAEGDDGKGKEEPAKPAVKAEEKVEEKDDKGHMIPKARYDSLRARMDELEKQVQASTKKDEPAPADPLKAIDTELDGIDDKIAKALADGDMAEHKRLRVQERALFDKRAEAIADRRATAVTSQSLSQEKFDRAVDLLESSFPALNPKHDSFDKGLTDQVSELVEAFQARGMSNYDALRKAVNIMEPQIKATLPPPKEEAKTEEVEEVKEDKKAKVEEERKATAVKKAVEAQKQQPANLGKQGQDADKKGHKNGTPNPATLSDEELDALPAETFRRMRGDFNVRART